MFKKLFGLNNFGPPNSNYFPRRWGGSEKLKKGKLKYGAGARGLALFLFDIFKVYNFFI